MMGYDEIPISSDVHTAAKILDCDPQTIRKLINQGELRAVRVGRLIRVPRESLIEFLSRDYDGPRGRDNKPKGEN